MKAGKVFLTVYANGMWQNAKGAVNTIDSAGASVAVNKDVNAYGAAFGGRLEIGGFKIGVGGNYDIGGGDLAGLAGTVPIDDSGELRRVTGYIGQAMLSIGDWDFAAGAGVTLVQQTTTDETTEDVIKSRQGRTPLSTTTSIHRSSSMLNIFMLSTSSGAGKHKI
jgi:hypothetical protein